MATNDRPINNFPPPTSKHTMLPCVYHIDSAINGFYDLQVQTYGYQPGLAKGHGEVNLDLGIKVIGYDIETTQEVVDGGFYFGEGKLPLNLDQVRTVLNKAMVSFDPSGANLAEPIPYYQAKPLAWLSYLPIEFPDKPITKGSSWTFKRPLGGGTMNYSCKVTGMQDQLLHISVQSDEEGKGWRDDKGQNIPSAAGAAYSVEETAHLEGEVVFDAAKGLAEETNLKGYTQVDEEDLRTHKTYANQHHTIVKANYAPHFQNEYTYSPSEGEGMGGFSGISQAQREREKQWQQYLLTKPDLLHADFLKAISLSLWPFDRSGLI